jgi:hypothetical protein
LRRVSSQIEPTGPDASFATATHFYEQQGVREFEDV